MHRGCLGLQLNRSNPIEMALRQSKELPEHGEAGAKRYTHHMPPRMTVFSTSKVGGLSKYNLEEYG